MLTFPGSSGGSGGNGGAGAGANRNKDKAEPDTRCSRCQTKRYLNCIGQPCYNCRTDGERYICDHSTHERSTAIGANGGPHRPGTVQQQMPANRAPYVQQARPDHPMSAISALFLTPYSQIPQPDYSAFLLGLTPQQWLRGPDYVNQLWLAYCDSFNNTLNAMRNLTLS